MKQLVFAILFLIHFSLFGAATGVVTKEDVLKAKAAHKEGIVPLLQNYGILNDLAKIVASYDQWSLKHVMAIGFKPCVEYRYVCHGCDAGNKEWDCPPHRHGFAESWKEQPVGGSWIRNYCLDISGLGLESLEGLCNVSGLRELYVLDASSNALTSVDDVLTAQSMPKLKYLNLAKNCLKKFPLIALGRGASSPAFFDFLTHVNLSDNPGLQIDEPLNPSLMVIHACNCGITQLHGTHFVGDVTNHQLRMLVVDGNELAEIPSELRMLPWLRVYAAQNRLSSQHPISHATIYGPNQKSVPK